MRVLRRIVFQRVSTPSQCDWESMRLQTQHLVEWWLIESKIDKWGCNNFLGFAHKDWWLTMTMRVLGRLVFHRVSHPSSWD